MPIYLDYNATTPLDPAVLEAMLPYLTSQQGNPSSGHWAGRPSRRAIDRAREQTAALLDCQPDEVVFTGGASEANNLCIKGTAWTLPKPFSVVTSGVEHASVAKACDFLARHEGCTVHRLPVDRYGSIDLAAAEGMVGASTGLVSVLLAQNEVGTIQPIGQLVETTRARQPRVIVHTDACQAGGKIPLSVRHLGVDLCVIAAHKFYGPKGTAAAYIRRGLQPEPLVHGVAHEAGRRAGTENTAGIVGMGAACELALARMEALTSRLRQLKERLWGRLHELCPDAVRQGHPTEVLPNTLNVCLPGVDSTALLASVGDQLAASNGAACHWGSTEPSGVLTAMGVPRDVALGAIRFSLGQNTTEADVDQAVAILSRQLAANPNR